MQSKNMKIVGERKLIVVRPTMSINNWRNTGHRTKAQHMGIRKIHVSGLEIKRNNESKKLTLFRRWV